MSTTKPVEVSLADEIRNRLEERAQARVRSFPRNQPIASDADPGSCLRRQVLEVVRWKDKAPIPADRQGRLEAGDEAERKAIMLLKETGFTIVREEVPFEIKHRRTGDPVLRGKIEAFIRWNGRDVPVEVKSLAPHVFARISSPEDFSRFWWTRKYLYQLQAYLIGYGEPSGLFLLTNLLGDWLTFEVGLDLETAERILSWAEAAVEAIVLYRAAEHESPGSGAALLPPFSTDPLECRRCPFFGRACNPPVVELGAEVLDDPDFEASLLRWSELKPGHAEFEGLDKKIKARARTGRELQVVGEFLLRLIPRHRKAYSVPATDYSEVAIERAGQPGETS